MIRLAETTDAAKMLHIYAPFIEQTTVTYELTVPTVAEFQSRIKKYTEKWPWLVYEQDDDIAGYAYAYQYREREAYQWTVECSVYINEAYKKQGIAAKLYKALFGLLKQQGFMTVYAVIDLPNEASVALHEKLGFTYFATYEKVGYKLGTWRNVGWWQLQLNDYADTPTAPIAISQMPKRIILEIVAV